MEYRLTIGEETRTFTLDAEEKEHFRVSCGERTYRGTFARISDHHLSVEVGGRRFSAFILRENGVKTVVIGGTPYMIRDEDRPETATGGKPRAESPGEVMSPIPATVVAVRVSEGDRVKRNGPVIVVTAMKMEMTLKAPYDGVVKKINVEPGMNVMPGMVLVDIEKEEADETRTGG